MSNEFDTYRVRVRDRTYLWGSQQIPTTYTDLSPPMYLTVRNEEFGEPVTLKTEWLRAGGGKEDKQNLGKLLGGQSYTLKLNDVTGVVASQDDGRPTFITCSIHGPA